jgi:hypothetical protein
MNKAQRILICITLFVILSTNLFGQKIHGFRCKVKHKQSYSLIEIRYKNLNRFDVAVTSSELYDYLFKQNTILTQCPQDTYDSIHATCNKIQLDSIKGTHVVPDTTSLPLIRVDDSVFPLKHLVKSKRKHILKFKYNLRNSNNCFFVYRIQGPGKFYCEICIDLQQGTYYTLTRPSL